MSTNTNMSAYEPAVLRQRGEVKISKFDAPELKLIQDVLELVLGDRLPRWQSFAKKVERVDAEPGALIFAQGDKTDELYLVLDGFIRLTTANPETGDRRVSNVVEPGQLLGSIPGVRPEGLADIVGLIPSYSFVADEVRQGDSPYTAHALSASVMARVPFGVIERLASRHVNWSMLMVRQLYLYAMIQERRHRELISLSPEQLYLEMVEQKPEMLAVLAKKDLASMIGITPESMSRITRRVKIKASK